MLEKLIESLKVKCKFADAGCTATVKVSEKGSHERTCLFESLSCPFPNCYFRYERYNLFQEHVRIKHPGNWGVYDSMNFFMKPKDRFHVVFGTDLCFVVHRNPIGTVSGRFGRSVGDMCYVTVLKVLSNRYAMLTSIPYMMKLKTGSQIVGGACSTFTIEADCCIDDDPEASPRDDGFVVVAEHNSVEILDIVFLPPRPPTSVLVTQR